MCAATQDEEQQAAASKPKHTLKHPELLGWFSCLTRTLAGHKDSPYWKFGRCSVSLFAVCALFTILSCKQPMQNQHSTSSCNPRTMRFGNTTTLAKCMPMYYKIWKKPQATFPVATPSSSGAVCVLYTVEALNAIIQLIAGFHDALRATWIHTLHLKLIKTPPTHVHF